MTAGGVDYVSDGRFRLGIGTSDPQVMEGFHGVPFDAPARPHPRGSSTSAARSGAREKVQYDGKYYQVPLPRRPRHGAGQAADKLINHPVRERIPITIAALGPQNVAD